MSVSGLAVVGMPCLCQVRHSARALVGTTQGRPQLYTHKMNGVITWH